MSEPHPFWGFLGHDPFLDELENSIDVCAKCIAVQCKHRKQNGGCLLLKHENRLIFSTFSVENGKIKVQTENTGSPA